MEVPTRPLLRSSAGVKHRCAKIRRDATQFPLFEGMCWNGRDLTPMLDRTFSCATALTKFPVGRVVLKLKSEQFQRQLVEVDEFGRAPTGARIDVPAHTGGKSS